MSESRENHLTAGVMPEPQGNSEAAEARAPQPVSPALGLLCSPPPTPLTVAPKNIPPEASLLPASSPDESCPVGADLFEPDTCFEIPLDYDGNFESLAFSAAEAAAAASLKLETEGITSGSGASKISQIPLWRAASDFKSAVAAKLREAGYEETAAKLDHCHSEVFHAWCPECHKSTTFRNRCDQFFCPECQPRLARNRFESVEWWTKQLTQPKHVVLTVRNEAEITKSYVQQVKKWFSTLRARKFCRNWVGGLYSLEVTNEGRGWHLHIHILVDARFIDAGQLSIEWHSVTKGAGYIVKVKDCRNRSYLKEVTKYAVKGSELAKWSGSDIAAFIAAFTGVRSFGVFGSLYGKRTLWSEWIAGQKGKGPKCECGCDRLCYYDENEWEAKFLRDQVVFHATTKSPPNLHPEFSFPGHSVDRFSIPD